MSDIGGQLGLWIGVSAVTCFEMLAFVYALFQYMLRNKGNRIKHHNLDETEAGNIPKLWIRD